MKLDRLSLLMGAVGSGVVLTITTSIGQGTPQGNAQISPAEQQIAELRQQLGGAQSAAQRAQVIAVVYQLDTAGFHQLDESISAGQIPPGALGQVRRGRIAIQATSWPDGLRDTASSMANAMLQLEAAIRAEDVSRAQGPASDAHELGHQLSDQAYTWLAGGSPSVAPSGAPAPAIAPAMSSDHAMPGDDDHDHDPHDHH